MRAAVLNSQPGGLDIEELSIDVPAADEVLIEVKGAGLLNQRIRGRRVKGASTAYLPHGGIGLALRHGATPYAVFPHGMLDPWFKRAYPAKHLKKWLFWPWGDYRVLRDFSGSTLGDEARLFAEFPGELRHGEASGGR